MPSLGYNYNIPFDEIKKLNLPVFSFGPHGKDPHKWTERILVDYSFEKVPVIFRNLIENILHMTVLLCFFIYFTKKQIFFKWISKI